MVKEIERLKKQANAVILAHNYQRSEVQDIADFVGDSLGLAKEAAKTDAEVIVFCGVRFMAETAKILSPEKTVLLPKKNAGCPMADMITAKELMDMKERYPDAAVVSYVNTNADVKALSDCCCTSANAVSVLRNIDADRVIFVPDKNLANYCKRFVDKEIITWDGFCLVHERISAQKVKASKQQYPDAPLLVHPECNTEVVDLANEVLSTGQMLAFVGKSDKKRFLIGTEEGLIYRLARENPQKEFYPAGTASVCRNMKRTHINDVYLALKKRRYAITLPPEIIDAARNALERMLMYA